MGKWRKPDHEVLESLEQFIFHIKRSTSIEQVNKYVDECGFAQMNVPNNPFRDVANIKIKLFKERKKSKNPNDKTT